MTGFRLRFLFAIAFLFLASSWPVPAQDLPALPFLDKAAVLRSAAEATREKYPNADEVLVDDLIRVRYETDGTSIQTDETYMKVLTEKGKRDNQTLKFFFTLPYGDIQVDILEVIKPDGTTVPVDVARQSRVAVDRSQMESNIYNPNSKVLQISVPGLEVGDVVRYRSIRRTVKPRVPNTWSDYEVLEYTSPIKRFVYEVNAPKALPLRSVALKAEVPGAVAHEKEEQEDRILYRWTATEVPRMYEEPDMPPLYTVVQRLLISTIADWRDISKWYWALCEPHLAVTEEIRRKVAELTRNAPSRQAKIEALFKFVSQQIRYMGITMEAEAPGYEPHDVRITFENKYGVCRDKAALLVAMLREAGIPAYPVLIHNGPKKDPDVPQPFFNHAVVAAESEGLSRPYILMDPTDENTRELFPSYLSDQSYLVARPEGETLLTSPIVPAEENLMRVELRGRLDANGALTAQCLLRFEGINDNAYRGFLSRARPEQRREFFEGLARRVVPGARLTALEIEPKDLQDETKALAATLSIEARDLPISSPGSRALMLPVPRMGARVGMVNFVIGRAGLEKRQYPLVTKIACGVKETVHIEAPDLLGDVLSVPDFEKVESEALSYTRSLACANGVLTGETTFLLKVVEFDPDQYLALREALKTTEYDGRKMPLFAARPAEEDAIILSHDVTFDVLDAHSWVRTAAVRKKILTYAGKKDNAELKFDYNPAWDAVTVDYARVIAPDGAVKEVQPQEMNVMDAGWAGAAPRYPAGKTLVVSLPGVEVGSVLDYQVTRTFKERPFFAGRVSFQDFDPIRFKRVTLSTPADMKLTAGAADGDIRRHSPAMRGVPLRMTTWTASDRPAVKRERFLPPLWAFTPTVFFSAGSWPDFARTVGQTLSAAASRQTAAEAKARAITRGLKTDADRTRAIRDFVAKNVRPAGPGLSDLPLSAVTPADRTLADGYGNSADRAVVLMAMLRAVGLKAEFVLVSDFPNIRFETTPPSSPTGGAAIGAPTPLRCPDPDVVNTVLVRVRLAKDGAEIYLNDTNQYDVLGATSHAGQAALSVPAGDLFTVCVNEGFADERRDRFGVVLNERGDALIVRERLYFGSAFGAFHKRFAEMPPEQRRRYHQEAVAGIAQAAQAAGPLFTVYDTYPGREFMAVTAPRFAVRDGDRLYLSLPETLPDVTGLRGETREGPLYWPKARRASVEAFVVPPPGLDRVVLAPRSFIWSLDQGRVGLRSGEADAAAYEAFRNGLPSSSGNDLAPATDRVLSVSLTADLPPALVPADEYGKLLDLQRRLTSPASQTILLQRN